MYIAELCVKRPVFATMTVAFLVVLGIFSFRDLGVDLFPKADIPSVNISITLRGASPVEIVDQVVRPLEGALNSLSGLDELNVRVQEGRAFINCRFVLDRDIEGAAQDVREKVAAAMRDLPPETEQPIVRKQDPDAGSVMSLNVAGNRSLRETTEIADKQIRETLETVDGVAAVDLNGGQLREIHILLDAEKLNAYQITVNQVREAIQRENIESPGGTVSRGDTQFGLRTLGRLDAPSEFDQIVVTSVRGTPIKIGDLGRSEDTVEDLRSFVELDGKRAVSLEISRQPGTNTVQVIDTVKKRLEQLKKTLPPDIQIQIIKDDSRFIKASVNALLEHLVLGSLLASLVVLLFIRDWRTVVIASLAIPSSIIATFTAIRFLNFTLNSMTLLALTLAVGIVIDDAVIVLENIFRYIEEKGYSPYNAAIAATEEIGMAVVATTLSLVIIFLPVAFITGFARRFVYQFGITMAIAVLVSLLVGFTLTPMLASKFLRRPGGREEGGERKTTKETKFFGILSRSYDRMLRWSLDHRWAVASIAVITGLCVVPLNKYVGRDWVPADDQGEFEFIFDAPEGYSVEGTAAVARRLSEKLRKIPEVLHVRPSINDRPSHCHIYIKLADLSQRKRSNLEIADEIRRTIAPDIYSFQPRMSIPSALGGGEQQNWNIQMNLVGPEFLDLTQLGSKLIVELKKIPGIQDTFLGLSPGGPEFQVKIDRAKAADLGVRVSDVTTAMRLMVAGEDKISSYREGDNQYDVKMLLFERQRSDPTMLSRLMIPSSKQGQVRLDSFATLERGIGPSQLTRLNRMYTGGINANLEPWLTMDRALPLIGKAVQKVGLPPGYGVRYSGQVRNLDQTTQNLLLAMLLAVIFMYMVLAAQFESFLHPLIIMLALPLSLPFALLTLYLTKQTLNLWSALGIMLLLAIVKKNGILQVDYANRLRAEGKPLREAVIEASHTRLRPILMTTAAIIAGLIPTAMGVGEGSQQRSAIATTIIGGQALCLLLTLLVTPVAYSLFAEMGEARLFVRISQAFARMRPGLAIPQEKPH